MCAGCPCQSGEEFENGVKNVNCEGAIVKNLCHNTYNLKLYIMFKNYFKTAWRTLWKNKIFSLINVLGLAIGISASLVIYLIASYDTSFDKFEKDKDRIYRVVWTDVGSDFNNHV